MGLTGADALNFIKEQQDLARETRQSEREEAARQREEAERQREEAAREREEAARQREDAERQREEAERQRNHDLELARLRGAQGNEQGTRNETVKSPKLPVCRWYRFH